MRRILSLILSSILLAGLFNFKLIGQSTSNAPLLGMVLLEKSDAIQLDKVISDLRDQWNLEIQDPAIDDNSAGFNIKGYTIAIAEVPAAIPGDEIGIAADYNYFWKNGREESVKHKGHVIITLMNPGKNAITENLLFNKVVASVLTNSESLGVYIGARTLLISKDFYLANSEMMSAENLPLFNWIYFGLRQENGKQSVYTYGLADFGKTEIEILDSKESFEDLTDLIFNITHYIIASDITLKDGETIGMSATQKLKIKESKGRYLEGRTLKIDY